MLSIQELQIIHKCLSNEYRTDEAIVIASRKWIEREIDLKTMNPRLSKEEDDKRRICIFCNGSGILVTETSHGRYEEPCYKCNGGMEMRTDESR